MPMPTLKATARTLCREGYSGALRRIPMRFFEPLRTSYPATKPAGLKHSLERRLLEVVRYRGIPDDTDVFSPRDNPAISFVRADSFITERLYWFGERFGYEPEGVTWWKYFCARSQRILELGANIGYYTVQGARHAPEAAYVAVEPHYGAAATCRRNLQVNAIGNVDLIEAAAVSRNDVSEVKLFLPGGRDHYWGAPSSGFVGTTEVHRMPRAGSHAFISVPAVELKSLITDVDLFKLDVEGQEFELLSSITAELSSFRPTVFLEVLDHTPKLRSLVAGLCRDNGYGCFVPTIDKLIPLAVEDLLSKSVRSRFGIRDIVLTCDHLP